MKWLMFLIVFCALPAVAQYQDLAPGERYNDDLIHDQLPTQYPPNVPGERAPSSVPAAPTVQPPQEEPPRPKKIHRPRLNDFEEVKTSQNAGDFRDVTCDGSRQCGVHHSKGSR